MENEISNSYAMSVDICVFAQALLKAKKEFRTTGLSGLNAHQKYKYAKLDDIYNAVENALGNNNIIIIHLARPLQDKEYLYTRLIHTLTGQYIEDARVLESEKPGNQAKGAACTYMRKYAVLCLCAIAASEDDDCEDEERYIEKKQQEPVISLEQIKELQTEIKSASNNKELYNNVLKFNKIKNLNELKQSAFEAVHNYIVTNKEQK